MEFKRESEQVIADEVDALMAAWRGKAARAIILVGCVVAFPPLLAVLNAGIFPLSRLLKTVSLVLFLVFMLAAVMDARWSLRWRVHVVFVTLGLFGAVQLLVTGMSGSGRITLMALPLIAVVLMGTRTGWLMTGFVLLLYAGVGGGYFAGWPQGWRVGSMANVTPVFWALQGALLATALSMLMVLLSLFLSLQRRTMIAERTALRKLEAETAERQRLEFEVARVSEAERRNLGSELHDGLCQHLTAALLNCTALENRQAEVDSPEVTEVKRIRETIEGSIDMAYDVARGLCPVDVDAEGLVSVLEGLCHSVQRRGILCELRTEGDVTVADPDCALQLYRIVGEALTNAVKHADAERILVRLTRDSDRLELSVTDNGKGIAGDDGAGLGRRIMAYRAGLIGGLLTVTGAPGLGTTVACRIPDAGGTS